MLASAIAEAKEQGFREMRLATGNPAASSSRPRFERRLDARWWRANE